MCSKTRDPQFQNAPSVIRTSSAAFTCVWIGQLVSSLGSGLANFSIGVWVYERTHSPSLFAMIALAASVPGFVLGPIAGALADRFDRRKLMFFADFGAALATLVLFAMLSRGALQLWHLCVAAAWISLCATVHYPAYESSVTILVPKKHFGRIGGLASLGPSLVNIAAPALAGILFEKIGFAKLLFIDFSTTVLALIAMLSVWSMWPALGSHAKSPAIKEPILPQLKEGWSFIQERRGLLLLLAYFTVIHFLLRLMTGLLTPMVLSFASPSMAGRVIFFGGLGMLLTSSWISVTGGPTRRIVTIIGAGTLMGVGFILIGLRPQSWTISLGMVMVLGAFPFMRSSFHTIWRLKVPPAMQGRIFSITGTIIEGAAPLAYLSAGPLSDRVFSPLANTLGRSGDWLGRFVGVLPGHGIGLLLGVSGLATIAVSALAGSLPRLNRLEEELSDQTEETPFHPQVHSAQQPGMEEENVERVL